MYLIPRPLELNILSGKHLIKQTEIITVDTSLDSNVIYYSDLLNRDIETVLGYRLNRTKAEADKVDEGIVLLPYKEHECKEAYWLSISEDTIKITGATEEGLLHGVQTLRQLVREYGASVPCMEIFDSPAMKTRGYCFDTTRGRVPTLESLKEIADKCSLYKLNQLQLNVEHSFLFTNESELWRSNTPLTPEDILSLNEYCKRLHIDLVPNLASFGHLYELLRSRTYSDLCELEVDVNEQYSLINRMRHHTVNVSDDRAFELVKARLKEYVSLFTSNYINICADETFDLGRGKNKARAEEEGSKKLYIEFLKKLCKYVMELGKTPMYWGDIIVEKPEIIDELPKDSICLNWEYSPLVNEENLRKFSETKAENIFVCPGVQSWNHLVNNQDDAYENISKMCRNGYKYNVKGMLNTDWGDLGHIGHPEFSTVGLIYGAAFSWNRDILPKEEINASISLIQYGDRSLSLVSKFAELANQENINWWVFVMYKEFEQGCIEEKELPFTAVMDKERATKVNPHNVKVAEVTEKLYGMLPALPTATKEVVNAYILMAEGQALLGNLAATMLKKVTNEDNEAAINENEMAVLIEKWYYRYTKLWRSVSKESELHRLGDILAWYADRLRE